MKNNIDTGVSPWQNATIIMNPEGMTQNASTLRLCSGSGISVEPWRAAAKSHRINRFHISRSMLRLYEQWIQTSLRLRSWTKWFGCWAEPKHRKKSESRFARNQANINKSDRTFYLNDLILFLMDFCPQDTGLIFFGIVGANNHSPMQTQPAEF